MKNKRILIFVFLVVTFILSPIAVSAKDDNLPSGVLIGDDTGLRVETDGAYWVEENNILPGHTFTREISIGNYSDTDTSPISLEMGIDYDERKPVIEGQENLLELIQVTYKLNGKVIYEGSVDGSGKNNDRDKTEKISLGDIKQGETGKLLAEFKVPEDVDETKWGSTNSVDYVMFFNAKRDQLKVDPQKKKPGLAGILPQTGEDLAFLLLGISIGFLIIILIIRSTMKRQKHYEGN